MQRIMAAEFPAVLPVMLLDHQRIDSVSSPAWGLNQNYYPWPNCWSIEAQNGLQTIFTMYLFRSREKHQRRPFIQGQLGRSKTLDMEVKHIPGKGHGVFVNEYVSAGTSVAKWKTT